MMCVSAAECLATGPGSVPTQQAPHCHTESDPELRRLFPLDTTLSTPEVCRFHGKLPPFIEQGTTSYQQLREPRPQAHSSPQSQLQRHQRQAQASLKVASLSHKFADVLEVRCDYQDSSIKNLISDKVNVKGRLRAHSQFWFHIGASSMVLSVINEGYRIPFITSPPSMFFKNNKSAIKEDSFVTETISELLSSGRIEEKLNPSFVVNPLSVAYQASGKRRLILDLINVNEYVPKMHFKLDDWKVGLQFLSKNAYLFSFDLKSGYHHIDISADYQKYLGFSWIINNVRRYFEFTVLPFGLSSAPLLFTKMMKPLVTHWRSCGILIALYLDDGFVVVPASCDNNTNDFHIASKISQHVKVDLIRSGLVYNMDKSCWNPVNQIVWLGMHWDSVEGTLRVSQRRVDKILRTINELTSADVVTIRKLHSFVGQIISLGPVVGNLTRLSTRNCQVKISQAHHEDDIIKLDNLCLSEIEFWKSNASKRNVRYLFVSTRVNKIVCGDASAVGSGAILCNDIHTAHKNWTEVEAKRSSTWRELDTILFAISSFLPIVSNSQLKIFTDSQSAARIVEVGSMKVDLHSLAIDIFNICINNNVRLEVEWIPRTMNDKADFVSRLIDLDDWMISDKFFSIINDTWGPFSVDCFASYYNAKVSRFFSRFWNPNTAGVDALAQDWSKENCLLVPPVLLIPSVLRHLYLCKGRGALVFPWWPSSPFWPLLWSCYRTWITGMITLEGSDILELGNNKNSYLGSDTFTSPVCAIYIDCTEI